MIQLRLAITCIPFVLSPTIVHAHLGHIGELAGHGHWIGIGAIAIAAGLAAASAAIGRTGNQEQDAGPESEIEDEGDDAPMGETS